MCGIFFSTQPLSADPIYLSLRGPDSISRQDNHVGSFVNARLITNPQSNSQPFNVHENWIQFNGTIYNTQNEQTYFSNINYSDLDSIHHSIKKLDGEFALIIANQDYITVAKDYFGTKPLYFYYDDKKFVASSVRSQILESCDTVYSLPSNTVMTFSRGKTIKLEQQSQVHCFDLTQTHNHWDYVHQSFEQVMSKMTVEQSLVGTPVSSGLDSGIIDCWCNNNLSSRITVTHVKNEDMAVVSERHKIRNGVDIPISHTVDQTETIRNCYGGDSLYLTRNLWNKGVATIGAVYETLAQQGVKIVLNGCGGDDIYSDYADRGMRLSNHSTIGGLWPKDLETVWPWWDTYKWLESELFYNDFIGGINGLETRFPLIDKQLIQAWLNTSNDIKNSGYKAWICNYLDQYKYPYTLSKHGLDDE